MILRRGGRVLFRPLLVVVHQRRGLFVVDRQAVTHRGLLVVFTLDQRFTGHIVFTRFFGRIVLDVIHATRGRVYAATRQTADDLFIRHGDFQYVIEFHTALFHGICLRNGAREAVNQKPILTVGLANTLFDQVDDDVIRHQTTAVHNLFNLQAQLSAVLDSGAQHIPGGNLGNLELLTNKLSLSPLPCAGGTQQD